MAAHARHRSENPRFSCGKAAATAEAHRRRPQGRRCVLRQRKPLKWRLGQSRVEGVMAADIEAVIAALRVALDEAQKSDEPSGRCRPSIAGSISCPGTWMGRWRDLKLAGDNAGEADREQFVGHVRAVVAFLEASRTPTPRRAQVVVAPAAQCHRPSRHASRRNVRPARPQSRSIFCACASRCPAFTDAADHQAKHSKRHSARAVL